MHAVKKKLCSRALGRIHALQSFDRQTIVRSHFTAFSGNVLVKESRRSAKVTEGIRVSGGELKDNGASSYVEGVVSILRKPKLLSLVRLEGLQIGGLRQMGITTRPTDRAAEHGVRTPLPNADGSPKRKEEERQDEFLRGSKREAASKVQQVEETVGLQRGSSSEAADYEIRSELGRNSADLVHETAGAFTGRAEFHSTGSQPATEDHNDDNLNDGIDEEVRRGLIADSEHPIGRVPVDDDQKLLPDDEDDSFVGTFSDGGLSQKEAEKDRTDKMHPYSADKLYSTDEALGKGQKQWEEGTSGAPKHTAEGNEKSKAPSGAPKLTAEDDEKSKVVYGNYKPLM